MKIGIKQGLIIGAAVLAGGGLLWQGALADPSPQTVPLTNPPAQTLTVNPPTGTGRDSVVAPPAYTGQTSPQTYQTYSGTPVTPPGSPNYSTYGGYGGMMGGGY